MAGLFLVDLLTAPDGSGVTGALVWDTGAGVLRPLHADNVVLASGGYGQLWACTKQYVGGYITATYCFLVDAPTFGWLLPFAVIGLPALLAVYTAIGVALARVLWTRGALRILALGVTLTATEWLRGHALTGFPWNAFGYALAAPLPLAQSASLVGLWGLTFIAIVVFASPATLADDRAETRGHGCRWCSASPCSLGSAAGELAAFAAADAARRQGAFAPHAAEFAARREIQLCGQSRGDEPLHRALQSRVRSGTPGMKDVTHLIWPELAFPFFLARQPDALSQITQLLPPNAGADHRRGARRRAGQSDCTRRL